MLSLWFSHDSCFLLFLVIDQWLLSLFKYTFNWFWTLGMISGINRAILVWNQLIKQLGAWGNRYLLMGNRFPKCKIQIFRPLTRGESVLPWGDSVPSEHTGILGAKPFRGESVPPWGGGIGSLWAIWNFWLWIGSKYFVKLFWNCFMIKT